jgi:translation initiation factor 1A
MGKKKRSKKNTKNRGDTTTKRALVFKQFQEEYAIITKKLGDRRVLLTMSDMTTEIMGIIPGRFRKRCWFDVGDLCLVSHREFQDGKVDIIYKYNPDERRELVSVGEIPPAFQSCANGIVVDKDANDNVDDTFEFSFDDI